MPAKIDFSRPWLWPEHDKDAFPRAASCEAAYREGIALLKSAAIEHEKYGKTATDSCGCATRAAMLYHMCAVLAAHYENESDLWKAE